MYVVPGAEGQPATLVWMSKDGVNQAILVAVPDADDDRQPGALQHAQRRSSEGQPEAHQEALTGAVP